MGKRSLKNIKDTNLKWVGIKTTSLPCLNVAATALYVLFVLRLVLNVEILASIFEQLKALKNLISGENLFCHRSNREGFAHPVSGPGTSGDTPGAFR
eukprot:2451148-Amphidinium_carterae.2